MKEKNLRNYSEKLKRRLSKISNTSARKFLHKYGYNSSSFIMPDYYQASGFDKIKLTSIDWKKVPATQTLDIFTPKGNLSWRRFSFFHPFMYWHIVNVLTEPENWKNIKKHLCRSTEVACYSTPDFKLRKGQSLQGQGIERWLQMAERDLINDCAIYNCLTVTDIQNFYSSIYTHSIAWALHSKDKARSDWRKLKLIGSKLDKLFQNSRDRQTNGIPIGSLVSDIIAEIVLTAVDVILSRWLKEEKIDSRVLVSRFRDDYRILSGDNNDANKVLKKLNRILHEDFNLALNPNKTFIYEDVIEKVFRPWDLEIKQSFLLRRIISDDLPDKISFYFLRDVLLETYRIQKKYPQGRAANTVLSKLAQIIKRKGLNKIDISKSTISGLIAILRKLMLAREEVTPYSTLLIDSLLEKYKYSQKKQFIEEMANITTREPDVDYQLIWFYRLCLSQTPNLCKELLETLSTTPPLLKILYNYKDFQKNKNYYAIFPNLNEISKSDQNELKKFSFLNIKKLADARNKKIDPQSINPFKYKDI
jgi:hypothetical protein